MRLMPLLFVLPLFFFQARAQTTPVPPPAPPAAAAAADAPGAAPGATAHASPKPHRMTWEQRFAEANVTHDGHLTLQQAEAGYPTIARHFHEIDADKKGYVTEEDISNWHKQLHATHHAHQGQPSQSRSAMKQ